MNIVLRKIFFLDFIISLTFLISYNNINILFFFISSILFYRMFYLMQEKMKMSAQLIFLSLMILSVPYSFNNMFYSSYGDFPLSWYNVFFLIVLIIMSLNLKLRKRRFYVSILLFIWLIIPLINSKEIVLALKDFLNFLPLLFFFCIETDPINKNNYLNIGDIYIISTLVTAFTLFIQFFLFYSSIPLGKLTIYPNRLAFGATFSDYSFLSLFLISGAALAYAKKEKLNIIVLLLLFASLLTSARTGLVAFILGMVIYSFLILKKKPRFVEFIKVASLIIFSIIIFVFLLPIIRQESLFEDSGRILNYYNALDVFSDNLFIGVGLGVESFKQFYGFSIPHNIIIQLMLQAGIISTILYMIINFKALFISYKRNNFFLALLVVTIGSMFIPDIMNSRFFSLLIFLGLNCVTTNYKQAGDWK